MTAQNFDLVVVGASLAGCTCAILAAREGLKVALVERHADPGAHKALCTHFIQPSATPVLRRLGLDVQIEAAGGLRNHIEVHTPYGWVGDHLGTDDRADRSTGNPAAGHGYNIRRASLDPMIRRLAAQTPGVTLMLGRSASGLVEDGSRIVGVHTGDSSSRSEAGSECLTAPLVVAADGRLSNLADLAGVPTKTTPTTRFGVICAFRGVRLQRGTTSQMWLSGPEVAYVFPNEDGITVVAWMGLKEDLEGCRDRPLDALLEHLRRQPDAPDFEGATALGPPLVVKDHANRWRPPVHRGMALVGDAQQSIDYLWGVGCGWAFQTSAWLVDALAPALRERRDPAPALADYERQCRKALRGHRFLINDFSGRRNFNAIERLMFSAAAKDVAMARHLNRFGARIDPPSRFLAPGALARAAWVNLSRRRSVDDEGTRTPMAPRPA